MNLHQLQVTYKPEEDRILFRISFRDEGQPLQEVRSWLTRRLLKNLWPGIIKSLKTQVTLDQPLAAYASDEIVNMEHQASLSELRARGDFNVPFETCAHTYPRGDAPVIITSVNIALSANQPARITFAASEKLDFEVAFFKTQFHGFCMLVQDCIRVAEWDIEPALAASVQINATPRVLN